MDTFNPFEKEDDGEEGEVVLPDVSSYPKENSDFSFYFNSMVDFISWASCIQTWIWNFIIHYWSLNKLKLKVPKQIFDKVWGNTHVRV